VKFRNGNGWYSGCAERRSADQVKGTGSAVGSASTSITGDCGNARNCPASIAARMLTMLEDIVDALEETKKSGEN